MNITPNNEKIEKYLDELAAEYKELLFNALISRTKDLDNLSVSELLRLDNEIKKPLFENYQKQQRRRRMLQIAGLTYMLLGFMMFAVYELLDSQFIYGTHDIIPLISVVIGFMGLIISMFSFMVPTISQSSSKNIYRKESNNLSVLEYKVVTKWRELEGIVNDISINANVKTPRSIIEFLSENKFIDDDEYSSLKEFLKMRNSIVHSAEYKYSIEEIKTSVEKIDKVIDKIKKFI